MKRPEHPLRVLVFCYEYPPIGGGAGNALAHLARLWTSTGNQVTVVTSHFDNLPEEEIVDGVKIIRLKVGRKYIERGRLLEMLRYMMVSSRVSDGLFKGIAPADLAVAFMTLPSGVAAARLKKRHGLPFVTELRGGDVPGFLPNKLRLFHYLTHAWIRRIWTASVLVIANSGGLAALAKKTARHIPVRVLPNGVDINLFAPIERLRDANKLCRCIFVGRLVDGHKKISRLIQAVHRLKGLELVIVGAGPDESQLKKIAGASAESERIIFKGWLKGDSLIHELRLADIYISASAWEGMSNSALEAMSCGLPLILSRISGHEELVVEGENGYLFDSKSGSELESHLSRLMADADQRARCGLASRKRAVEHFDWSVLAEQHLDLYRQALKA